MGGRGSVNSASQDTGLANALQIFLAGVGVVNFLNLLLFLLVLKEIPRTNFNAKNDVKVLQLSTSTLQQYSTFT